MAFVPEGQCDRSLARSAWESLALTGLKPQAALSKRQRVEGLFGTSKFQIRLKFRYFGPILLASGLF
jgi:hypothetical protein